jgi:hypothetical protein
MQRGFQRRSQLFSIFTIAMANGRIHFHARCLIFHINLTSEQTMNECNSGLRDLLSDIKYLTSRGLRSLLSSDQFKHVQDKYQLPTAFDSTEAYATATAFAVGCDY